MNIKLVKKIDKLSDSELKQYKSQPNISRRRECKTKILITSDQDLDRRKPVY